MTWKCLILAALLLQVGPQEKASLTGIVLKMGTSDPLSKATVTLSPFNGGRARSYTATTSSNGQFVFQNVDPGRYRLAVTRNGFIRTEYGARTPNQTGLALTLNPDQRLPDIVLQMMPAGVIAGRVFDRDGEPLPNVTVEALKYAYQEGHRVMRVVQTARTNDLGEYRLFWFQPGQYFVSAVPESRRRPGNPSDEPPSEDYIPAYYPGTTDPQSAAPINLPAGVVFSGVDVTVASLPTVNVQGQLINGVTGQPVRNARITLFPFASTPILRNRPNFPTTIDDQGRFQIRAVVPGRYELAANLNDRTSRMTARMVLEIGNADVRNVALVLSPGYTLTGTVTIEGAASNENQLPQMRVMLRADADQSEFPNPAAPVTTKGTFNLQEVGRDDYRLTVSGMPQNAYIKTARYGSTDVLNQGLRLDRPPNGSLDIVVSTNTGTATGVVQNDKQEPSSGVTVVLIPDAPKRDRLDLYRVTTTDAMGIFHLEGVPPGDYKAFSWEDIETGAWQDPDFIRDFENRGKPVRIEENGTVNIELKVIPSQA